MVFNEVQPLNIWDMLVVLDANQFSMLMVVKLEQFMNISVIPVVFETSQLAKFNEVKPVQLENMFFMLVALLVTHLETSRVFNPVSAKA